MDRQLLNRFCVVCSNPYSGNDKQGYEDVCPKCLLIIEEEAPGVPLYDRTEQSIDDMIEELNRRIPELFVGPVCPGDCSCSCTYVSGCLYKEKKTNNPKGLNQYKK